MEGGNYTDINSFFKRIISEYKASQTHDSNATLANLAVVQPDILDRFFTEFAKNGVNFVNDWRAEGSYSQALGFTDKLILYMTPASNDPDYEKNPTCVLNSLKKFSVTDFNLHILPKIDNKDKVSKKDIINLIIDSAREGFLFFDAFPRNVKKIENTPIIVDRNSYTKIDNILDLLSQNYTSANIYTNIMY